MELSDLTKLYAQHPKMQQVLAQINDPNNRRIAVGGLCASSRALFFASLFKQTSGGNFFFILNDEEQAAYFYNDLTNILRTENGERKMENDSSPSGNSQFSILNSQFPQVFFFPSSYKRSIKYGQLDAANEILRTEALTKIIENGKWKTENCLTDNSHSQFSTPNSQFIIVSYPEAIIEKVVPQEDLADKTLSIGAGEKVDTAFVVDVLTEYGFERVDFVYEPGQFSLRGGIIDVFSFSHELPYRIDFFGNEVESIRIFDIETQLSREKIDRISIVPKLQSTRKDMVSIFQFMKDADATLCFWDMDFVENRIRQIMENGEWKMENCLTDNGHSQFISEEEFSDETKLFKIMENGSHPSGNSQFSILNFQFNTAPQPLFHKNFNLVSDSLKRSIAEGYTLYICSDSKKQTDRIASILESIENRELKMENCLTDNGHSQFSILNSQFTPVLRTLHEGFIDHDLKLCVYTDHQIFDRFHKFNLKSDKARAGKVVMALKELNQFQLGDYVTHIDHGVGRFGGLMKTDINGTMQEMVKLIYKDDDIIFVSIHALHRISKYKGKDGEPPRINKLGTGAWQALKERTKKKVKDIARDLIQLYAKRNAEAGFAYSPDSYLQHELEASFIYEDTPDQVRATADVKRDMQRPRPMDRLICGDVGFGKTEVAVRAAFKAATDGKQVAVLVPTTVLALQHYKTFSERLKDFPCTIDYLSRARSTAKSKEILSSLKEGKIDIIIGTHKLIGKTVQFKDLGLLVVDEEQKFGVAVKDKLKQMKANVDTLTMTATPIPRTLQFSLMGARDLSVMHTPPPNRYPILTELHEFNEELIRDAILHEMSRNGQVFFVNNRIQNIYQIEALLKRIVPEARVAVGHGQMESDRLEQIILDFVDYEYDVLIATSIIESGIDIPNANTIIINKAHTFGLSDLHQLRGRVGRTNRKAYCYLMAPPAHLLTSEARRRLQAIENFSELGSGFSIAMQDLDIRGAGNMLGAEQSGFIADLGYETYLKILNEAVNELKMENEELKMKDDNESSDNSQFSILNSQFLTIIETDMELLFPHDYVENVSERMTLYRELDNISDERSLENFITRMTDRFGALPPEALDLIQTVRLRFLAAHLGIEKLTLKNERMTAYFTTDPQSSYFKSDTFGKLLDYALQHPRNTQLREQGGKRSMIFTPMKSVQKAFEILSEILSD